MQQKDYEIIPISQDNEKNPTKKELIEAVHVLNTARETRCQKLFPKKLVLCQTLGLFLLVTSIIICIYVGVTEPTKNRRKKELTEQQKNLSADFFSAWKNTRVNNTKSCENYYPASGSEFICTLKGTVILAICVSLMERYCSILEQLNGEITNLGDETLFILLLVMCMIFIPAAGAILLDVWNKWLENKQNLPSNSYTYIPEDQLKKITQIADYLGIGVDKDQPVRNLISLTQDRINELHANQTRAITFFSGIKNKGTELYQFITICDPPLLKLILSYLDPLLINKNTITLNNKEETLLKEEEETSLLTLG
jgi:hypothetical protein